MYNEPFLSSSQEEDKMTYSNFSLFQFLSIIHECHSIISTAADQPKSFYFLILLAQFSRLNPNDISTNDQPIKPFHC